MKFSLTTLLLASTWLGVLVYTGVKYFDRATPEGFWGDSIDLVFPGADLVGKRFENEMDVLQHSTFADGFTASAFLNVRFVTATAAKIKESCLSSDPRYTWSLNEVALMAIGEHRLGFPPKKWCWRIEFSGAPLSAANHVGDYRDFEAYLLMDGTVVIPHVYSRSSEGYWGAESLTIALYSQAGDRQLEYGK